MEKERRITAPDGCEIEKVEIVDGAAVVTFREKERKLPKSWEEFCKMYDVSDAECYIDDFGRICNALDSKMGTSRDPEADQSLLPDLATAEAVLALCQLVQLRNAYNGDWVPDWTKNYEYVIEIVKDGSIGGYRQNTPTILYFKTEELRNEFLRNFRPLIEKLMPLYGIKEGGEQ